MYLNLSDKFDKYIRRPVHASSKTVSYYKLKTLKSALTDSFRERNGHIYEKTNNRCTIVCLFDFLLLQRKQQHFICR